MCYHIFLFLILEIWQIKGENKVPGLLNISKNNKDGCTKLGMTLLGGNIYFKTYSVCSSTSLRGLPPFELGPLRGVRRKSYNSNIGGS